MQMQRFWSTSSVVAAVALGLGSLSSTAYGQSVDPDSLVVSESGGIATEPADTPWLIPASPPDRCQAPVSDNRQQERDEEDLETSSETPDPVAESESGTPAATPSVSTIEETPAPADSPTPTADDEPSAEPIVESDQAPSPSSTMQNTAAAGTPSPEVDLEARFLALDSETPTQSPSTSTPSTEPEPEPSSVPTDSPSELDDTPTAPPTPTNSPTEGTQPSSEPSTSPTPPVAEDNESSPSPTPSPESTETWVCPEPPVGVSARSDVNEVGVSWSAPSRGAEPEAFYVTATGPDGFAKVVPVEGQDTQATIAGLKNGVTYAFTVTSATRHGSSAPSGAVTSTPSTGMEGVVAGVVVEFEAGRERQKGDTSVPGEERVSAVDLVVADKVSDDAVLVELSEPVDQGTAEAIAAELTADSDIAWAEPNQFFFTATEESDQAANPVSIPLDSAYASSQWNLWDSYGIGVGNTPDTMTNAWAEARGDGVTVAVIDTGITAHSDLDGQVVAGYDFVSSPEKLTAARQQGSSAVPFDGDYVNASAYGSIGRDANPLDPGDWRGVAPVRDSSWHGTKIAGVIAAAENTDGVAGIAPDAKIQPVRALSWRGGLLSDIAASITWASGGVIDGVPVNETPSQIINMSFAVETTCPNTLQDAIDGAIERGSLLVAAAGNAGDDASKYAPANCNGVLTVAASNRDGVRADYSNYGSVVDVSAPGGDGINPISTTSNDGATTAAAATVGYDQGTSVAAAHVSGAAAVLASRSADATPATLFSMLTGEDFTQDFANPTCDAADPSITCGSGIVQIASTGPVITSISPTSGTVAGGTSVTVTGTGFTGATSVTFDGVAGTSFTFDSDTQVSVTTPVRSADSRTVGPKQVVVVGAGSSSTSEVYFTFAPIIDSSLANTSKVELGALASRTQGKSIVRSTSSPYTVTGTDSRSGSSYSYTSDNGYISGSSVSRIAYNYEGFDVSTPGSVGGSNYSSSLSGTVSAGSDSNGDYLHLASSGGCSWTNSALGDDRYCSVFGPEVFSESFYAEEGQSLAFSWRATAQNDDYEIYAYLVGLSSLSDVSYSTDDHTILAHAMGNASAFTTTTGVIPTDGYYRFRFVNGTYDGTGGKAVGSNMYVYSGVTVATTNVITFPSISDKVTSSSWTETVTFTSSSGAEVSVAASGSSGCSVSTAYSSPNTTATITGSGSAGSCTLLASQGASGIYAPASDVTRTFEIRASAVAPGAPTISSLDAGPGEISVNFTAPNQDGGAPITNYEYQLDGGSWVALSPAVTLSPFTITGLDNGTAYSVKIRAVNSAGGGTASNAKSATPALLSQATLSIVSPSSVVAGSTLELATSGGSGTGQVTFTPTGTCTVSGSTLTPGDAGSSCSVVATKDADNTYDSTSASSQSITVTQRSQTLAFTSSVPSTPQVGGTYTASAESSETTESLTPSIAVTTGNGTVCSAVDNSDGTATVSFLATGTCVLTASQSGSANVDEAADITQTIAVGSANQSITFAAITDKDFGTAPFAVSPTSSSGLAVSVTSSTTGVCTVSGYTVTLAAVGTCTLTASQAGNGSFAAASDITRSFAVDAVVPGKPRISSISSSTQAVSIGFDAPASDGGSSILNYVAVATPTAGGSSITVPCSDTNAPLACTVDGLTNGTEYTVVVAATNAVGTGANSDASDPATPAGRANAVTGAFAIPGDSSVDLYWEPISSAGLAGGIFVRYEVYMREEGAAWPSTATWTSGTIGSTTRTASFSSFDDASGNTTSVDNEENYEFKIVVISTVITTEVEGNTTLVTQSARSAPSAIRNLTVTELSSTSALVTWDAPLTDGGAPISGYTIVWSDGITCGSIADRSCTATGLEPGTAYTVSGRATNYVGSSTSVSTTFTITEEDDESDGDSGNGLGSGLGGGSGTEGSETADGSGDPSPSLPDSPSNVPDAVNSGALSGIVMAGDSPLNLVLNPNSDRDGWEGAGPGFAFEADALMPGGQVRALSPVDDLEVPRTGQVRVRANGYVPNTSARLFLVPRVQTRSAESLTARALNEWIYLGTTQVSDSGALVTRHPVPASINLGQYILQVHGTSQTFGALVVHLRLTVIDGEPDLETTLLQRAAFFQGRSGRLSSQGKRKVRYLASGLPEDAQAVQVRISGVSVSLDTFQQNLELAGERARVLAEELQERGVEGRFEVSVYSAFTVDAAERLASSKENVASTKDGKPLTTATIMYLSPST